MLWLEIAERQYLDLPDDARELVDARLMQLTHAPSRVPDAVYDPTYAQWSVTLGGRGFMMYALVTEPATVIVLLLVLLV